MLVLSAFIETEETVMPHSISVYPIRLVRPASLAHAPVIELLQELRTGYADALAELSILADHSKSSKPSHLIGDLGRLLSGHIFHSLSQKQRGT